MRIEAWRVHDTGLVAAPGPFRRLPGVVRHHQGRGPAWPDQVTLELVGDSLVVQHVGAWGLHEVSVRIVSQGPPVTFVVELPDGAHLLSAPGDAGTASLLAALGESGSPST